MARDPKRIDRVLGKLRAYWHAHPDLRLGQILGNAAITSAYYMEDEAFEAYLDRELTGSDRSHLLLG
jgi:uncharacterized protein YihD (DUF1040 family)